MIFWLSPVSMTSRWDYCNSLLYGINGYLVSQLQCYQNNAARIVSLRRKYDHITPVLKELHWLPVEQRINYKILLLAYVAQKGMDPSYWSSLLSPYKPGRPLLSQGKHLLTTPHYPITITTHHHHTTTTTTTTHHCHYLRIIIINGFVKAGSPHKGRLLSC